MHTIAEFIHQNFGIFGRFSGFDVSGTHGIECGSQVGRVLGPDRGPDAGAGMTEFEASWRAARCRSSARGLRQHRIGAIHGVAAQGMPNRGEMHANLMSTVQVSRFTDTRVASWPKRSSTSQCVTAGLPARVHGRSGNRTLWRARSAPQWLLCSLQDHPARAHDRFSFYLMLGELPTHLGVRKVGLAHQHQAGSAYIKARNNALTPGRTIGSDMHAAVTQ